MKETLISYLLQHKSLGIPGLGTIYVERTPAQNDFVNKRILPPGYHYRFDQYFDQPDKDFFNYIANHLGMADFEAIKWYNEWAYDVRNQLRSAPVYWKGIGTLSKDENGEFVFEAERVNRTALTTVAAKRHEEYGNPVLNKTVEQITIEDEVVTAVEEPQAVVDNYEYPEELFGSKKSVSSWTYAIILAVIAVLVIVYYLYGGGGNSGFGSNMPVKLK